MEYTTLTPPSITVSETEQRDLALGQSLYEALQHLPDPRRRQGKRYELALLLCLLLLAKLAGQTTLCGATEWIRHRADVIAVHFGLNRKQMPCQMTSCRMLARVDPKCLDELLSAFFLRRARPTAMWERTQSAADQPRIS